MQNNQHSIELASSSLSTDERNTSRPDYARPPLNTHHIRIIIPAPVAFRRTQSTFRRWRFGIDENYKVREPLVLLSAVILAFAVIFRTAWHFYVKNFLR